MFKGLLIAASLAALMGSPALAAPCKDAKGKFVKCPPAAAAPVKITAKSTKTVSTKVQTSKVQRCRNAKGQFAKCGTAGAKPV